MTCCNTSILTLAINRLWYVSSEAFKEFRVSTYNLCCFSNIFVSRTISLIQSINGTKYIGHISPRDYRSQNSTYSVVKKFIKGYILACHKKRYCNAHHWNYYKTITVVVLWIENLTNCNEMIMTTLVAREDKENDFITMWTDAKSHWG